jgi:hypothetical protein
MSGVSQKNRGKITERRLKKKSKEERKKNQTKFYTEKKLNKNKERDFSFSRGNRDGGGVPCYILVGGGERQNFLKGNKMKIGKGKN